MPALTKAVSANPFQQSNKSGPTPPIDCTITFSISALFGSSVTFSSGCAALNGASCARRKGLSSLDQVSWILDGSAGLGCVVQATSESGTSAAKVAAKNDFKLGLLGMRGTRWLSSRTVLRRDLDFAGAVRGPRSLASTLRDDIC